MIDNQFNVWMNEWIPIRLVSIFSFNNSFYIQNKYWPINNGSTSLSTRRRFRRIANKRKGNVFSCKHNDILLCFSVLAQTLTDEDTLKNETISTERSRRRINEDHYTNNKNTGCYMKIQNKSILRLFFSGGKEKNNSSWKSNRKEIIDCWSKILKDKKRQNDQTNQVKRIVVENWKCRRFKIRHFIRST